MSSTFEVPIIKVKMRPHPNADTLSLVSVFGWQCVVKTDEWKDGDLGAYIRPDSIVPATPEFSFLEGHYRVKTHRFRKEWSHGLLIKAPEGSKEGDNVADKLGITAYDPPSSRFEGDSKTIHSRPTLWRRITSYLFGLQVRPRGHFPHYDVEHLRRYLSLIQEGTEVIITEKIHGANALYVCKKPWIGKHKIYFRSRTVWKSKRQNSIWKRALDACPELQRYLYDNHNSVVYGEVYGRGVQDLEYGATEPRFVAFDIWRDGGWIRKDLAFEELDRYKVPTVPVLRKEEFDYSDACELATKNSCLANYKHIGEGIVVTTLDKHRKQLKIVNDKYLEKVK